MPGQADIREADLNAAKISRPQLAVRRQEEWSTVLGELIAQLDQPGVAVSVLTTLSPDIARQIEQRAAAASLSVADFVAGAVRELVEHADDDLWLQLLTVVRKSEDPGLSAVQTILAWTATER